MRLNTTARWTSTLGIITTIFISCFCTGKEQSVTAKSKGSFLISQNSDTIDRCFLLVVFDPNDTSVNFRSSPNGKVLKALPNLTSVSMEVGPPLIDSSWTLIQLSEQEKGYVFSDLLHRKIYTVFDSQDQSANLRNRPNGSIIQAVPNGTEVEFRGVSNAWTKVKLKTGQEGYIYSKLLKEPDCF